MVTVRSKTAEANDAPIAVRDSAIQKVIFAMLAFRHADATVCPSEVARALRPDDPRWRALMPQIRQVAADLVGQGRLRVTRRGVEVDALARGGPIRLGRSRE